MIVNPREFAEKCCTGYDLADVAQNGMDVRLDKLYLIDSTSPGVVNGKTRQFPRRTLVTPENGTYTLLPGRTYECVSTVKVKMPEDMAGWFIHRSSLLRCGVWLTSGVYDSSFSGGLNLFAQVTAGPVTIGEYEKLAQFMVFKAHAASQYQGYFQGTVSTADLQDSKETK